MEPNRDFGFAEYLQRIAKKKDANIKRETLADGNTRVLITGRILSDYPAKGIANVVLSPEGDELLGAVISQPLATTAYHLVLLPQEDAYVNYNYFAHFLDVSVLAGDWRKDILRPSAKFLDAVALADLGNFRDDVRFNLKPSEWFFRIRYFPDNGSDTLLPRVGIHVSYPYTGHTISNEGNKLVVTKPLDYRVCTLTFPSSVSRAEVEHMMALAETPTGWLDLPEKHPLVTVRFKHQPLEDALK